MITASSDTLALTVTNIIHALDARGWTPATSSNFSWRTAEQAQNGPGFWISRSGVEKARFCETDWLLYDPVTNSVTEPDASPSAETALHTWVYGSDPTARCVLHVHSPAAVVVSRGLQSQGYLLLQGWELQKAFAGVDSHDTPVVIPVVANSQQMADITQALGFAQFTAKAKAQAKTQAKTKANAPRELPDAVIARAFLIAGHGLYAWGTTPEEAYRHVMAAETLCQAELQWQQLQGASQGGAY